MQICLSVQFLISLNLTTFFKQSPSIVHVSVYVRNVFVCHLSALFDNKKSELMLMRRAAASV